MRIVALFLFALAAFAQDARVLFRQKDAAGWTALGEGSVLGASEGALVLQYDLAPKKMSGIVIGAPQGIERMRSIELAIETDHDTAVAILLSEKKPGGGNYAAWFWSPAKTRQHVELTPADFSVTDGPGDPVDADGKLDLDQVEGIGIFDLAQFFLSMPRNPELPITPAQQPGRHTFSVRDFAVLTEASAAAAPRPRSLDTLDRGFLDWLALGGMKLAFSPADNPLGRPAMRATSVRAAGQLGLLVRRVGDPALATAKRLSFDIASERETTLVIALEMRKPGGGEGPRFSLPIYPPGGKEVFHVDLSLADFKGPDGAFDPAQWRSIAILDATEGGGEANTFWIGKMEAR